MAHAAALRALQALPPETTNQSGATSRPPPVGTSGSGSCDWKPPVAAHLKENQS